MSNNPTLGDILTLFDLDDIICLYDIDQDGMCVYRDPIKDLYTIYHKATVLQIKPQEGEIAVAICW